MTLDQRLKRYLGREYATAASRKQRAVYLLRQLRTQKPVPGKIAFTVRTAEDYFRAASYSQFVAAGLLANLKAAAILERRNLRVAAKRRAAYLDRLAEKRICREQQQPRFVSRKM
jgi:hypothetical protein